MMMLCVYFLLMLVWCAVLCASESTGLDFAVEPDTNFLASIIATHYNNQGTYVNVRIRNGYSSEASQVQQDLINGVVRTNSEWMMSVAYSDLPCSDGRPGYYNVFLVRDYHSLCNLLRDMTYKTFHFHGLYTIIIEEKSAASMKDMMEKLWSVWIINVVVIVEEESRGDHVAYSYDPYREGKCGSAEPLVIGRHIGGVWSSSVGDWFPDRTLNFNGCPLKVGLVEVKPYSMFRQEDHRMVYFGLEVYFAQFIARRLNFSIQYEMPKDNFRWGILHTENSTGLVGMIQRREVAFGFGSLGLSLSRHTHLKSSTPSHMTQMIMAIPPKRPYTSLEKLFQPFTIDAWVCIGFGYAMFGLVTIALLKLNMDPIRERLSNPVYTLWVLLMGGSGVRFRLNSWRIFVIGYIVNTLVIRTLYQAGMFERLRASAPLASDLNTIDAINKAGLFYTMYPSTVQFYKDNPMVPNSHIRVVKNDSQNWDEIFYALSQDKLDGVIALPLDCIAYYVKRNGKRGVIYIGEHTGFTYNIGMHFPKTTPLLETFNVWILKLHASGQTRHWTEEFRDNRYWTNAKENPEPASLKWNQISGGFLLCGVMLLVALVVFFGEKTHFRFFSSRK